MPRFTRFRRVSSLLALLTVLLVASGLLLWSRGRAQPPQVSTRNALIDVKDGPARDETVQLDTTLYLPGQGHTPAPAVLIAHGFGGTKQSVADQATELARRGFVVATYSARGFGRSTGQIALNSLDYEVTDARQLIDWLARQPEVLTDGPNDPRVGVTGSSYGGALAVLLAGIDKRVDAIAPVITYNDLAQSLLPNSATSGTLDAHTPAVGAVSPDGVFKKAWAGLLFSAGGSATPGGDVEAPRSSSGIGSAGTGDAADTNGRGRPKDGTPVQDESGRQPRRTDPTTSCGRFRPEVCQAYVELATTGRPSQQTVDLLRRSSPGTVAASITVPSLVVQGEQDTLFGLDQSDTTARQIASAGGKVKTIWYAGGHDGGGPGPELRAEIADWFSFHLAGHGADPGTGFEYAVQGAFRSSGTQSVRTVQAPEYPGLVGGHRTERRPIQLAGAAQNVFNPPGGTPAALSTVPGLGSALSTASNLGAGLTADMPGQSAAFTSEPMETQLLLTGSPTVRLRISGTPGEAVLFGKVYDVGPDGRRTLPGGGVAAMRLTLPADGVPVEVTVTLPGVVRPVEAGHRLQLVVSTTDQAYSTPVQPASFAVGLAGDSTLAVPIVPGTRASASTVPVGPLLGIGGLLLFALATTLLGGFRRRHSDDVDAALADVPIVTTNLRKAYPGGLTAVDGLSFRVEQGQVLGLLGPNGAGKTTVLRMLMGLVKPTEGQIRVFGHRVRPGSPVLSRIGSFVEGSGFLPHLSGTANLELYWAATGRPTEQAGFAETLKIAGLGDAVLRRVGTYSQGMRQRLAIAQAMLGLPDLLVLDEPTNGLDPPQIHHMRDVLRRYAATGRTVVVSSHLLAEVEQTCDHVVVMHRGKLVASGEVAQIVAAGGEATFRVDEPVVAATVLRNMAGVTGVTVDGPLVHADLDGSSRSAAVNVLVDAGVRVDQAGPRRRLEDAFLRLVGDGPVQ